MECDFTEKVSMLMDGELPQEEIEQVSMHIDTCSICRQARQDFLDMRQQIRSYESRREQAAEARALAHRNHPSIPTTYHYWAPHPNSRRGPGYLRRWISAETIGARVRRTGPEDIPSVVRVLRAVGSIYLDLALTDPAAQARAVAALEEVRRRDPADVPASCMKTRGRRRP